MIMRRFTSAEKAATTRRAFSWLKAICPLSCLKCYVWGRQYPFLNIRKNFKVLNVKALVGAFNQRGLLPDYKPSCRPSFEALVATSEMSHNPRPGILLEVISQKIALQSIVSPALAIAYNTP